MNAIVDALRARYRTPREALIALDLDPDLLNKPYFARDEDRTAEYLKPLKPARDVSREALTGERDDEEIAQDDPAERLHAILRDKLSEEALREVGEILFEMATAESDEDDEDDEDETELEREDGFEETSADEAEEPWRKLSARSKDSALGAKRGVKGVSRAGAMDAASQLAFDARYPSLARVSVDTGIVPLRHDGSIQNVTPRKSSAGSASFDARFPALKRLVA